RGSSADGRRLDRPSVRQHNGRVERATGARLRVVVVGGGVGGLALARGLHAQGQHVTVVEAAYALRTSGATVQIWFNGMAALRNLGISLDGIGQRIDLLEGRCWDGSARSEVNAALLARRFGVPAVTIARRRLLEHLAEGLPQ